MAGHTALLGWRCIRLVRYSVGQPPQRPHESVGVYTHIERDGGAVRWDDALVCFHVKTSYATRTYYIDWRFLRHPQTLVIVTVKTATCL